MAKTKKKPVPEQSAAEVPLYTLWDVARYLRLPLSVADALSGRYQGWPEPDFLFRYFWRRSHQLTLLDDEFVLPRAENNDRLRMSFHRFADLFVRAGVLFAFLDWLQADRERRTEAENFHRTIWRRLEDTSRDAILFDSSSPNEEAARLCESFAGGLDEEMTALLKKHLLLRLDRVEIEGKVPIRIYPPTRDPVTALPRSIVLDPRVRFGRPTLVGHGLPTDTLFERYQAGDSIASLARDYDITSGEVEEAIRFESRPSLSFLPFPVW